MKRLLSRFALAGRRFARLGPWHVVGSGRAASLTVLTLAGCLLALGSHDTRAQGRTVPEAPPPAPRPAPPTPTGPSSESSAQALPTSVGDAVGIWDLALVSGGSSCTLTLTGDSGPNGRVVQIPGNCRRSMPILQGIAGWLFGDGGVRLVDRNIRPLLQFLPSDNGRHFVARAGGRSYMLSPVQLGDPGPVAQPPVSTAPMTAAPPTSATPPSVETVLRSDTPTSIPDIAAARPIPGSQPVLPANTILRPEEVQPPAPLPVSSPASTPPKPATPPAAEKPGSDRPSPGIYALDRSTEKDVCRIALDARPASLASAPDTTLAPARLLPGCRDSGITVFEPVSWRFANGHITLKAKRGHSVNLVTNGEGAWRRDPDVGTTFVLRRVEP